MTGNNSARVCLDVAVTVLITWHMYDLRLAASKEADCNHRKSHRMYRLVQPTDLKLKPA